MPYEPELFDLIRLSSTGDFREWFVLTIEGTGYVFTPPGVTTIPTTAAARIGTTGATVKPLLKVGHGIDSIREEASRRKGVGETQEITIALGPDEDDFLLGLFASDPSDLVETEITSTVDWQDTVINVLDTTGYTAGDIVHLGKEGIEIGVVDVVNSRFTGCTRAKFWSTKGLYVQDADLFKGSVNLRSHPSSWEGRTAALWMGQCSAEGTPLDEVEPVCIFRGPISSMPKADDWVTWTFSARDLTAKLNTQIGSFKIEGRLLGPDDFVQLGPTFSTTLGHGFIEKGVNDTFRLRLEAKFTDGGSAAQDWDETLTVVLTEGLHESVHTSVHAGIAAALLGTDFDGEVRWRIGMSSYDIEEGYTESAKTRFALLLAPTLDFLLGDLIVRFDVTVYAGDINSGWPMLGYSPDTEKVGILTNANNATQLVLDDKYLPQFDAPGWPILYKYTPGRSRFVPVVIPDEGKSVVDQVIPSTGLLALGATEVVSYDSITGMDIGLANVTVFTVDEHNLFDSEPLEYRLTWTFEDAWLKLEASGTDDDSAKVMWGVGGTPTDDETIFSILLKLAISCGGNRYLAGDYAPYDTTEIGEYQGAQIPGEYFDLPSFDRWAAELSEALIKKSFAFAEPMSLKEIFSSELVLLGLCLVSKPVEDGAFRMALVDASNLVNQTLLRLTTDTAGDVEVDTAAVAGAVTLLGDTPRDKLQSSHDLGDLINQVIIRPLYSVAAEKQFETKAIYNQIDSQIEFGTTNDMRLDAKGWGTNLDRGLQATNRIGPAILATFAHRRPFYEFQTTRAGWALSPGDQVSLTVDGFPNESGTRGLTGRVVTILSVEKRYFDPGGTEHCRIKALANTRGRFSYYCPSGAVTSKGTDGTGHFIQIAANAYSPQTVPNFWGPESPSLVGDILWFAGSDVIRVYTRGAEDAASEVISVASVDVASRKVYLDSLPALTVDADTVVTYAPHTQALSDSQRQFAFISDNDGTLLDDAAAESDGNRYL